MVRPTLWIAALLGAVLCGCDASGSTPRADLHAPPSRTEARVHDDAPGAQPDLRGRQAPPPAAGARRVTTVTRFYDPAYLGPQADRRTVEVYSPPTPGPHPCVVYVHGGGLTRVGPNRGEPFATALSAAGIAVALVGYRLSDTDLRSERPDRIRHPDHVRDVAAATRYLRDHAGELGLDSSRFALMGHSAGALLTGVLMANPLYMREVGLRTTDWTAGVLIDSEAYRMDDIIQRSGTAPLPKASVYGVRRSYERPLPEAMPTGFSDPDETGIPDVPHYDSSDRLPTFSPTPILYPALLSGPGEPLVLGEPHPHNVSAYHDVVAGSPVAPMLFVYGTAPGRAEAAHQMVHAVRAHGGWARTLEVDLNHGRLNWYFGRPDLGQEAKRYTRSTTNWLRHQFGMPPI